MYKIGHRGARGYEPENTLRSFNKAIALGADMVECDVKLTADNQLVIFHDKNTERLTDCPGLVNELTLAELKELKLEGGEKILTLKETLAALYGRVKVNLELKDVQAFDYLIAEISRLDFSRQDILVSSNYCRLLRRLKQQLPQVKAAWLFRANDGWLKELVWVVMMMAIYPFTVGYILRKMKCHEVEAVNIHHLLVSKRLIDKIHQYNKMVIAWTVDNPAKIKKLKQWGIDGIISNYPDRL
ncbi:MAG TPA: glycerophosphodiester phosphodiesterase [Patescibacteria group bacterium]|nr:glycerophosphodiester phosphodiesterase [Patescibacteria group bacterium]